MTWWEWKRFMKYMKPHAEYHVFTPSSARLCVWVRVSETNAEEKNCFFDGREKYQTQRERERIKESTRVKRTHTHVYILFDFSYLALFFWLGGLPDWQPVFQYRPLEMFRRFLSDAAWLPFPNSWPPHRGYRSRPIFAVHQPIYDHAVRDMLETPTTIIYRDMYM